MNGRLTITVFVTTAAAGIPHRSEGTYNDAVTQGWKQHGVQVLVLACTKDQAREITTKWRERNPGVSNDAQWEGPSKL